MADRVNAPYRGFQDALERIGAVLGLLDDGLLIDELVANDYRPDPIRQVADHHWDNWDESVR